MIDFALFVFLFCGRFAPLWFWTAARFRHCVTHKISSTIDDFGCAERWRLKSVNYHIKQIEEQIGKIDFAKYPSSEAETSGQITLCEE